MVKVSEHLLADGSDSRHAEFLQDGGRRAKSLLIPAQIAQVVTLVCDVRARVMLVLGPDDGAHMVQ